MKRQSNPVRSRHLLLTAGLVAVLALAAGVVALANSPGTLAAQGDRTADVPDQLTIRIHDVDDTGISGKATLRANDGITTVGIRLTGADEDYPAHLHEGNCADFEAMPGFPLADTVPGQTTRTVLDVSMEDLLQGHYVVNIHQPAMDLDSLLDPSSVVACGEVTASRASTGEQIQPPMTGIGSTITGGSFGVLSVGLAALAMTMAVAGVALRRWEQRPSFAT